MSWWRKIWIGLFVLTAAVLLSVDSRLIVDAAYLTLVPLTGGTLILLFCKGSLDETGAEMPAVCGIDAMWKRENRFHLVLSALCTILFVLMLSASQILFLLCPPGDLSGFPRRVLSWIYVQPLPGGCGVRMRAPVFPVVPVCSFKGKDRRI